MKYLINAIRNFDGTCKPISKIYKDSAGNDKYPTNISVVSHNGDLLINTRITDYAYIPVNNKEVLQYITDKPDSEDMVSCNVIQNISKISVPKTQELLGDCGIRLMNGITYKGIEDIRLVSWNDKLYGIGSRPDVIQGRIIIQLLEYNDNLDISKSWFIDTGKNMEKNWQPIEGSPFTFMYDPDTSSVIKLDMENLQESDDHNNPTIINNIESPEFTGKLSGSSQLMKLNDGGYISICHTSHFFHAQDGYPHWMYNHYFVVYDKDFHMEWQSPAFKFTNDCMEFCCGMCHHKDDVYISFSMYDGTTHMISLPYEKFIDLVANMQSNEDAFESQPDDDYLYNCFVSGNIQGKDRIIYMFFLELLHKLNNADEIASFIEHSSMPAYYKKGILLYFISRRKDNEVLLNQLAQYV